MLIPLTAPLKAIRPSPAPRPLPPSHELLAIQSYLLQSAYNVLPSSINPSQPLDANIVLGFSGEIGSPAEQVWLKELENERGDEIVIWFGGDGTNRHPHDVFGLLEKVQGSSRHPTLIPCHGRTDLPLLKMIFDRLKIPLGRHPLIMIGNEPIIGDAERLEEMRSSGRLAEMLGKIGWRKEQKDHGEGYNGEVWRPKLAKAKKREVSEVEEALRKAR